ncbi:hypothetical protein FIV42_16500 [Persicimonas caeni]|uniref:Aminotransferase class I/II-fold pyridoxal phosphate-dependent enzyme n=1 Tax=Persicimonas caeni TaxID=2292766 RepID=A0A4Y6PVL4_PERCE|nr:hypothetical protein [Persicimonas caeni]QDG52280.1 hypothetical protein FIV42_16500 [Persicimonas caeni]QED33502.1 hypothetical protein FRD00_16495 [Persicimonas caeni]
MLDEGVEHFRPLMPMGYQTGADAYRKAAEGLSAAHLSDHYTEGLDFLRGEFGDYLKATLAELTGGAWKLDDWKVYAAGSDVDLMTHLVEAVAASGQRVHLFPGDWYGFLVGCTREDNIHFDADTPAELACLCLPSVRNGQLTDEMVDFLGQSTHRLLNINLFPTLDAHERRGVAEALAPVLDGSVLSVSFSRGFGLTASQLGVFLVPPDHPYNERFERQWNWLTYFYNQLAARAFMEVDIAAMQAVDAERRAYVHDWLERHDLPVVETGSYYVKAFRVEDEIPEELAPLVRGETSRVRLCFKPPHR